MGLQLGMDPEFVFVRDDNHLERASAHVRTGNARFGTDGVSSIAELRPRPFEEPKDIVNELRAIMRGTISRKRNLMNYKWRAGSYFAGYSLGGHIHFGFNDGHDYYSGGSTKINKIRNALDSFVAPIVLLMEDKTEAIKRRQSSYGRLGNVESKQWGFEYRTLPSFIVSPTVTEGVLALSKVVASEVLNGNNPDISSFATEVGSFSPNRAEFANCNQALFRKELELRWKVIKKMSLYMTYKEPLEQLKKLIMDGVKFSDFEDMKESWEVPSVKTVNKWREGMIKIKDAEEVWRTA